MDELQSRIAYVELAPGERVEVIHHVKVGSSLAFDTHTIGLVVAKERREVGLDSGFIRNWDDKYWSDHLVLRKDDGELTTITIDEFTELRRLASRDSVSPG